MDIFDPGVDIDVKLIRKAVLMIPVMIPARPISQTRLLSPSQLMRDRT